MAMESVLETVGEMTRSKTKIVCMLGLALRIMRLPSPLTMLILVVMIMISMSHKKLVEAVKSQSDILCSNGTITLKVLACDKELGLVCCRCENSAVLGERKNINIYGCGQTRNQVDILKWGIRNKIVMIARSL
ncbi:hypothetical protein M0R45_027086 [Rubus argutus]|uniref:Pyruvate kinase barrel domain-containing protein n=1 Tax=Rubus argutus TaxID=59490 RepID=A0AAW1X200_RUBAR